MRPPVRRCTARAASDFYGECSSLVSVPKVVSAIDSFNFVLVTAASALLFYIALDFDPENPLRD